MLQPSFGHNVSKVDRFLKLDSRMRRFLPVTGVVTEMRRDPQTVAVLPDVHHQLYSRAWPSVVGEFICADKLIRDRTLVTFHSEHPAVFVLLKAIREQSLRAIDAVWGDALGDGEDVC